MKIDKKRALYQHYKKLQDKYDNMTMVSGIYNLLFIAIGTATIISGLGSIPFIRDFGWFYQGNFEKLVCQLDRVRKEKDRSQTDYFLSLTRNRDMGLPLEERRKRIVKINLDPFYLFEYLNKAPDTLPYEQSPILDSIPLWVNKNTGRAFLIQKHSPDKIDFWAIDHTMFFLVFIFSLPIFIFYTKFLGKHGLKKANLQKEIAKTYEEWENYSSYK